MNQRSANPRAASDPMVRMCAFVLAGIWIYQGLVPKLLGPHPDEISMIRGLGVPLDWASAVAHVGGIMELGLGLGLILMRARPVVYWMSIAAVLGLSLLVVVASPAFLLGAFNAVAINAAMLALAAVGIMRLREYEHDS